VIRTGLKDSVGYPVTSSITMRALKQPTPFTADSPYLALESLRAAFNSGTPSLFDVVQAVSGAASGGQDPWDRDRVLVLWTFHTADKTLSLTPTVAGADVVPYPAGGVDPFALTGAALKGVTAGFTADVLSWLDLRSGTPVPSASPVGLPATAFLAGAGMSSIPSDQLGNLYFGLFQSPVLTTGTTESVYFLLTMPDATLHPEPAAGYPVVVFQHGLTRSKEDALAIANSLAQAGFATLAIDAPFHGNRTPDGHVSGDLFLTANLLQDRANLYHAAMDLWETLDVIDAGIDVDGGGADLDPARIDFMSHSLGSMIGTVFLSQETRAQRMILSSPTALLADTLDETKRTDMQAVVSSLGYTPGTTPYYVFLDILQWLLDPVDGSYNGIGSNSTDSLLVNFAYGDPEVSTNSSRVFLANIGISTVASYDPDQVTSGIFPAVDPGAYEYGVAGKPVIHTFLLSPEFNLATEPWYVGGGYSQDVQDEATYAAQVQAAGFLAAP
jgi:alpha/beta hydrolase fold